jgi:hypothetical protein
MLQGARYETGAFLETTGGVQYMIATVEKALVDKVWTDSRFGGARISDFNEYLVSDLRIEEDALRRLDESRLKAIANAYDSLKINRLVRYIERLRRGSDA